MQVAFQPPPPPPPLPSDAASVVRFDAPPAPVPIKVDPPPVVSLPLRDVPLAAVPQDVVEPASALPEPTIFLGRNNLGDTPMLRTWKTLALYSLVAAAPVVVTAPAAVAQDNTKFEKQVEDLKKQFDSLKSLFDTAIRTIEGAAKSVDALKGDIGKVQEDVGALKATKLSFDIELTKTNAKIDNLEKQLTQLQSDINSLRRELSRPGGAVTAADRAGLEELKKHLVGIEQAIIKLQPHEPGTANRIALSSPTPTARVLLVNMYHEDILFVINDKAYRVAPRSLKTLESVPAGPITYEVISPTWGLREQKTRSVSANETFSLTVQ
ncbi:MAG: hypothetical protein NZO58_00270 [Gemmataceae bacterium]|nr:hypothetical protein [Gemmataceae bacterium]